MHRCHPQCKMYFALDAHAFFYYDFPINKEKNMNTEVIEVVGNAAAAPKNDTWALVVYCLVIFAIVYFLMIRPNRRRMAEYQKMLDSLKVGNRVMAAGIYGTIKKINEKSVELEVSKGVVIEVNKNAVAGIEGQK
jgi:preprotein translocase subunit YajC